MSEDIKLEVIKRTQDALGKHFKKPPLTEKLLKKPPFRFIQDIVSAIIKETGFFEGLYTEEELSADISKDKEAKLSFLTKLIDVVKLITGVNLTVRATKIISGHEPTKTNELLYVIGRALDKKVDSKEAIIHYKNRNEKKLGAKKSVSKEQSSKKLVTETSARSIKAVKKEHRVNEPEKKKTRKVKTQDRESKDRVEEEKTSIQLNLNLEDKFDDSPEASNEKVKQHLNHVSSEKAVDNVSANRPISAKINPTPDFTDDPAKTVNKPQTPRPKSVAPKSNEPLNETKKYKNDKEPVMQDSVKRADSGKHMESEQHTGSGKHVESVQLTDSEKSADSIKHKNESNTILQNTISRENTVSAKLSGSNWIDLGNNTAGVANIIVENSEKKEEAEDDMVIIETNKGSLFEQTGENEHNVTEEHGYLVAQILKTEQELVKKNNADSSNRKVEIVWQTGIVRDRESVMKTVGNLRNLIQTLIKFTNPLGKVLDYLQGDMEIMQKELMDYRNQYAAVNKLLEEERMLTDKFMHHMNESLEDIESNVYNQLNKIHQVKINILKNEHQIQRPVLKNDEGGSLEKLLRNLLPPLYRPKTSIPWSQLRKMKREERIAIKKSSQEQDEISPLSKAVVTGINAVTRGLEKKDMCSVLLDSNVESIVIKHIVTMSEHENLPVVLIPFLKIVTLDTMGFGSAAFALKIDVKNSTDHHFRALYQKILELSASFARPKQLVQLFSKESSKDEQTTEHSPAKNDDFQDVKTQTVKTFTLSSNVYWYRLSCEERVFIPEGASADTRLLLSPKEWNDFIPLGEDTNSTATSDVNVNNKIRKRGTKVERYTDFSDKIDALNEKVSLKNESGEIFVLLDTSSATGIKNCDNEISETEKLYKNSKEIKRSTTTNFTYAPLKVKRMHGNSNRVKATKAPKSKTK